MVSLYFHLGIDIPMGGHQLIQILHQLNKERISHWLGKGAKPSDSVRTLLAKHLTRDLSAPVEAPAAS
jgi:ribosomal protein S16